VNAQPQPGTRNEEPGTVVGAFVCGKCEAGMASFRRDDLPGGLVAVLACRICGNRIYDGCPAAYGIKAKGQRITMNNGAPALRPKSIPPLHSRNAELLTLLRRAGDDGMTLPALLQALNQKKEYIFHLINGLRRAGHAITTTGKNPCTYTLAAPKDEPLHVGHKRNNPGVSHDRLRALLLERGEQGVSALDIARLINCEIVSTYCYISDLKAAGYPIRRFRRLGVSIYTMEKGLPMDDRPAGSDARGDGQ
jgi:hypothetical protein